MPLLLEAGAAVGDGCESRSKEIPRRREGRRLGGGEARSKESPLRSDGRGL